MELQTREVLLSQLLTALPEDEALDNLFEQSAGQRTRLSHRDLLILRRKMEGLTLAQIGIEFHISGSYIRQQIVNIRRKLVKLEVPLDVPELFPQQSSPQQVQLLREEALLRAERVLSELRIEGTILFRLQVRSMEKCEVIETLPPFCATAVLLRLIRFGCITQTPKQQYQVTPAGLIYFSRLLTLHQENFLSDPSDK